MTGTSVVLLILAASVGLYSGELSYQIPEAVTLGGFSVYQLRHYGNLWSQSFSTGEVLLQIQRD